ncbi:MAG: hypothetical protein IKV03_05525 [Alphaproteobacteria bacterium]|nr:hypothetical protein [Alphaproteobacteria bacterium]
MSFKIIGLYTVLHFLVDFACAVLLYFHAYPFLQTPMDIFYAFLLYNFFAFAIQLPIGILADTINKNVLFVLTGCLLVIVAYLCASLGIMACVVAGLGNACFHVGAGIDVLNLSNKKAAPSGIFVSSGALGIFLGAQPFMNTPIMPAIFMILLSFGGYLSYRLYQTYHDKLSNITLKYTLSPLQIFMIGCLCVTVLLRSYTGFVLAFEWKSPFIIGLVFTVGIVLGKALGGILGDKFGFKTIAIASLTLSAVCFFGAFQNNVWGILFGTIGVLLFNMTMPITLTALVNFMPAQKGMAFGLLTFMLFLGAIPVLYNIKFPYFNPVGLSALVALSGIILYGGLLNQKR